SEDEGREHRDGDPVGNLFTLQPTAAIPARTAATSTVQWMTAIASKRRSRRTRTNTTATTASEKGMRLWRSLSATATGTQGRRSAGRQRKARRGGREGGGSNERPGEFNASIAGHGASQSCRAGPEAARK